MMGLAINPKEEEQLQLIAKLKEKAKKEVSLRKKQELESKSLNKLSNEQLKEIYKKALDYESAIERDESIGDFKPVPRDQIITGNDLRAWKEAIGLTPSEISGAFEWPIPQFERYVRRGPSDISTSKLAENWVRLVMLQPTILLKQLHSNIDF